MTAVEHITIAGNPPPVAEMHMTRIRKAVETLATENDMVLPVELHWAEFEGNVVFFNAPWLHPERQERLFTIGAPIAH